MDKWSGCRGPGSSAPIALLASRGFDGNNALVEMRHRRPIDQETKQLWATIVATRIHEPLTLVYQSEVEIGNHAPFAGTYGLTQQFTLRRNDRGKAAPEIGPIGHPVSCMIRAC